MKRKHREAARVKREQQDFPLDASYEAARQYYEKMEEYYRKTPKLVSCVDENGKLRLESK